MKRESKTNGVPRPQKNAKVEVEGKKPREKKFPKRDQVAGELDAFAACVREGREPEPSGEEGVADLRVLDAIRRAVETRRVEAVHGVERRTHPGAGQAIARPPHEMPAMVHAEAPGKS